MRLAAATDFTRADLARLFTDAYEGYFVPFRVDEPTLAFMVDAYDLDLSRSLVAVDGETPVGLANLGLRGERTWLGGVGVVASRRRQGLGERLCRALLDQARGAGASSMALEVIVENTGAVSLYEKLGFEVTRELAVLTLPADGEARAPAADLGSVPREPSPPWQREDETIAKLDGVEAVAAGDAAAVYRVSGDRVSLLQAIGDVTPLLPALRARGALTALNFPSAEPVARALRAAGAEVVLRQLEMVASL